MSTTQLPPSPPPEPNSPPQTNKENDVVPLDSSTRTTPIHNLLPNIRVPSESLPTHRYHPVTCNPLDVVELRTDLQQLRKEYSTSVAALKAQEEAAREVKKRIEEAEEKTDRIQKLMKRKTEERDTERRVFLKIKRGKESKS